MQQNRMVLNNELVIFVFVKQSNSGGMDFTRIIRAAVHVRFYRFLAGKVQPATSRSKTDCVAIVFFAKISHGDTVV